MAKKIVYVDEPPAMEVKKGLVHIKYDDVAEFVMSPASFRRAIHQATEAMRSWERDQNVVEFKKGDVV